MPIISKNKPYSFIKNLEFYTIKRIKDIRIWVLTLAKTI